MTRSEFSALQAEWRKRLAASGFDDIESPGGELRRGFPLPVQTPRAEYFAACRDAVNAPDFVRRYNPRQQRILELHADGVAKAAITRAVKCRPQEVLVAVGALRRQIGVRQ